MFAPGDGGVAGNAVAYSAGFGSPALSALTSALGHLEAACDGVGEAVTRHDRIALTRANDEADALVEEINGLIGSLSQEDRELLPEVGVPAICQRLGAGARRNAYLIERAWAVDAALMRLLLGLGRVGADGSVGGYSVNPGPTYVDRQA